MSNRDVTAPKFGKGLPPAGGWKQKMLEDPTEYSPEFQDEYRRLWHEAAAERDRLLERVRELEDEAFAREVHEPLP